MCNRVRSLKDWSQIPRELSASLVNFEYNPNVAPTENMLVFMTETEKKPVGRLARFGINLTTQNGKKRPPLLNARTDTLRRGSFRTLVAEKRCVIPAEGFYEWREENGKKQPYYFYRLDGKPILFAGIWDNSEVKGDTVASFAILTDEPNELIAQFHDRMPVVVDDPLPWLQGGDQPLDLLEPLDYTRFGVRPVNPAVNKVAEKDLSKIEAPFARVEQGVLL